MSGGPVVNADGELIGIVSSSFEGGPTYVTLIWDALRLRVESTLPPFTNLGAMSLFAARDRGFVRISGNFKRRGRADVVLTMSETELKLFVASVDPALLAEARAGAKNMFDDAKLENFNEKWSHELENAATTAAIEYLQRLALPSVREFLGASDIDSSLLTSMEHFSVEDFEGLEDPEVISVEERGTTLAVSYLFDLLSVIWTVHVPSSEYLEKVTDFEEHFLNVVVDGDTVQMELIQRCYFEAELLFDTETEEFLRASIKLSGVKRRRRPNQGSSKTFGE